MSTTKDIEANENEGTSDSVTIPGFVLQALASGKEVQGLTSEQYISALEKHGYNEVIVKEQPVWWQLVSRYLGIVPLFIATAAVLSAAIETTCPRDTA